MIRDRAQPRRRGTAALLVLVLATAASASAPPSRSIADTGRAAAPFDSAAVVATARSLGDAVRISDAAALWAQFDDRMRAAMGDQEKFETELKRIASQTGPMQDCLRETVERRDEYWIYRAVCRFAGAPVPLVMQLAFTPGGRVAGFFIKPDAKAYDSPFADYRTRSSVPLPVLGEWKVIWGGRTLDQNDHAVSRDQRFAYDLVAWRDSSDHHGSGRLNSDYYAFGQVILAPDSATVVWTHDGVAENVPGRGSPSQPVGNGVVLDLGHDEYLLLAHFQRGSVRVVQGQHVAPGDTLGLVGNSGNSSQPHLHAHLQNGPTPLQGDGLPLPFVAYVANGKSVDRGEPVRGDVIRRAGP